MLRILFVLFVVLAGGSAFPWWWPAVPGVVAGFWRPASMWRSFLAAFAGAALAFAGVALWLDVRNGGLLAGRIAPLFHVPGAPGLIVLTAVTGGVTAGLGALFGVRFRRLWHSLQEALAEVAAPVPEEASQTGSSIPVSPLHAIAEEKEEGLPASGQGQGLL